METAGFYKFDNTLLYGPNFVLNRDYELRRETKDQHTYPVDGWYWFDSEEAARAHFGLPATEEPLTPPLPVPPMPPGILPPGFVPPITMP